MHKGENEKNPTLLKEKNADCEFYSMINQDYWRNHRESTISEPTSISRLETMDTKIEEAAKIIQLAVRRWLNKRLKDQLAKCQPYLNLPITEERAIKLQQEIDAWQHHHKNPPMTSDEFAELHHKARVTRCGYFIAKLLFLGSNGDIFGWFCNIFWSFLIL